jgi:hypothetical protein
VVLIKHFEDAAPKYFAGDTNELVASTQSASVIQVGKEVAVVFEDFLTCLKFKSRFGGFAALPTDAPTTDANLEDLISFRLIETGDIGLDDLFR